MTRIVTSSLRVNACALVLSLAAAAQDGLEGVGRTIDGRTLEGRLVVSAEGSATIGGATLPFAELLSFERSSPANAPVPSPHRVWLRSGLQLPATKLRGKSQQVGPALLVVTLPSDLEVEVPIGMVRALRHGGSERPEPALFAADLQSPPANGDLLYVQKDGKAQRSQVTVTGMQPDRVDFTLRDTEYDFAFAGVTAIVFGSNTGFPPDRQPRPRTTVALTTGERLEGRFLALDTLLQLRLDEGAVLSIPLAKVHGLDVASDRLVWLSDLTPTVEQVPAFDRTWPWNRDRSPAGPGLLLDKRPFTRGIGMVPRTRLTYDLGGNYDVFEAWIGIDDRGGPQAHAIFRVLVDGKVAFESAPKTIGMPAEAVRVELGKCRTLAIEVDFGKNYDLGDFCAFADARVVQQ